MEEKNYRADRTAEGKTHSLPEDAEVLGETRGYRASFSRETNELIIEATDYHCGDLYLSKSDLEKILEKLTSLSQ